MLEGPKHFVSSSQVLLVPRQVLLGSAMAAAAATAKDEERKETKKRSSKEKKEKKEKKKEKLSETLELDANDGGEKCKDALLRSIAAFLERNGFSKTLTALTSEAQFEVSHHESPVQDLEDLFGKSFYLSGDSEKKASVNVTKEDVDLKEPTTDEHQDPKQLESAEDTLVETKEKKKRKKSISSSLEGDAEKKQSEVSHGTSESTDPVSQLPDAQKDNKDKRKKKHKKTSDSLNMKDGESENIKEMVKESIKELKFSTMSSEPKDKAEKKKEKKAKDVQPKTSEVALEKMPNSSEGEKSNGFKEKSDKDQDIGKSMSIDKSTSANEDNNGEIGKKASKKRKRKASEEADIEKVEDQPKVNPECGQNIKITDLGKVDNYNSDIEHSILAKKLKTEKEAANGNIDNNGTGVVSSKKEKHPKEVTPFQRVKVDEVKFADERLKDNSYWAKDGADSGYGAKAQDVLGQVRGRDFRHEKTKKKRGTYRGGQIDMQSHSIKFSNSDDE